MLDSNPDATSAHIVVNIASLPSTVTALGGAACGVGGSPVGRRGRRLCLHLRRVLAPALPPATPLPRTKRRISLAYDFLHSFRRSSHSDQRLFLSRLQRFSVTGGDLCETTLSSRNAAAFSQFTVAPHIRQGIAPLSLLRRSVQRLPLFPASVNSEDASKPARDGSLKCSPAP